MATISPQPKLQFFQASGSPLSGGKLYTYAAGTTTPLATYTSSSGGTANANPVVLNSRGEASVWLGDAKYKFKLTDSANVEVWTVDNLDGSTLVTAAALAASTGSSLVGYAPTGTGAVATTVQNKLRQFVTPFDFGAVGNGSTNDRAALKAALESGHPVDGCGYTYAIDGSCTPTSMVGLQNATLVQIGNPLAGNIQTLNLVGLSNFFVDNVTINMGSAITTLFSDDANSGLYIGGVNPTTYVVNFMVTRVKVTGNGCGAGIQVRHGKRFVIEDCLVYDRTSGSSPDPTNDSQDGIEVVNCANFTLANCQVYNLKTRLSGTPVVKWTRGFLIVEVRDCSIVGCNATAVDQGFDVSGAYDAANNYTGNRRWTMSGCTANSCGTYGFKFANVTRDGLVMGCIANNTATIGFVFSGSSNVITGNEKYNTQNIDVVGCKVVNVLGNGWSGSNAVGFRVMQHDNSVTYPRSIRFKDCAVLDTQDTPTTLIAYQSDAQLVEYGTSGYNTNIANTLSGCTATSNIPTFATGGIGPNICQVTGDDTHTPATGWHEVDWNTGIHDPTGLHNPSSNNSNIFIKAPGWYRLSAMVHFAGGGTGQRQSRFLKNGTVVDRSTTCGVGTPTTDTVLVSSIMCYANSGDSFRVEAYQDGTATLKNNESHFSVELIGG